jgi:hypothetical protein
MGFPNLIDWIDLVGMENLKVSYENSGKVVSFSRFVETTYFTEKSEYSIEIRYQRNLKYEKEKSLKV